MHVLCKSRSKIDPKNDQTSSQNRSQVYLKSFQNRQKIDLETDLLFCVVFDPLFGGLGAVLGSQNGATIIQKSIQKSIFLFDAFLDRFWLHFASLFGLQNPLKSVENRCPHAVHFGVYFLIYFGSVFAPNCDPLDLKKHCFFRRKNIVF